jgi:hypothetical protein
MKKAILIILMAMLCVSVYADPFADVPNSHWAYRAIKDLSGRGILQGYKDGTFKGNRTLTRYEAAMMVAKVMSATKGGGSYAGEDLRNLEKLIVEFSDELSLLGVKITSLEDQIAQLKGDMAVIKSQMTGARTMGVPMMGSGKIDITGDMKMTIGTRKYETDTTVANAGGVDELGIDRTRNNDWENEYKIGLNIFANIDEDVTGFVRLRGVGILGSDHENDELWRATQIVTFDDSRATNGLQSLQDLTLGVEYAYVDIKNIFDLGDLRLGRQNITLGHNLVYAAPADAVKFDKVMDQVSVSLFAFDSNDSFFDTYLPRVNGLTPNAGNFLGTQQRHENGFDSKAVNLSVDFGGHAVGFYYFTQSFDNYDPFVRMGDRYATKYIDVANAGLANNFLNAAGLAGGQNVAMPSADPSWMAITLDGNVMENLDYFFEYIKYDSDLASFNRLATDPADLNIANINGTIFGANQNPVLPGRELEGTAWLLGLDWDLTDDLNLILQYGVGDEEFVPSTIDIRQRLNGMMGRFNSQASRANYYWAPTGSLQGVKDIFAKVSYDFNDKTSGYFSYENCKENDSSNLISVVNTDGFVYNLPLATAFYIKPSEYKAFGLGFKHQYRPNTAFTLDYTKMQYDQNEFVHDIDAATANVKNNIAPNAGGWQMIKAAVEVKF